MTGLGAIRAPETIIFGKGQRASLGRSAITLGTRALICTDARLSATPEFAVMIDDLKSSRLVTHVFDQTLAELPFACVEDCVARARPFAPDVVIGIGGGSCMDLAKAAAVLLTHGGNLRDYYGEFKVPGRVMPLVCVPTTSGTGSEVRPVAVLGDPEKTLKVGIASPHIISKIAICDPELTYTYSPELTALSGADALTHAIEAFTALRRPATRHLVYQHVFLGKNLISDRHALTTISLIARSLPAAVIRGDDETAREDVMLGALFAGLAFGTAGTTASHAIQYPVGAFTKTAHGTCVALLLPYVMDFNRSSAVTAFAEVAVAMGATRDGRSEAQLSEIAVETVAVLFAKIGIPKRSENLGCQKTKRIGSQSKRSRFSG